MKEVLEKKKQHSKLAYKPTECYPLDWDHETAANSTMKEDKWREMRPAGVTSVQLLKTMPHF